MVVCLTKVGRDWCLGAMEDALSGGLGHSTHLMQQVVQSVRSDVRLQTEKHPFTISAKLMFGLVVSRTSGSQ